jgi:hypothetical protein
MNQFSSDIANLIWLNIKYAKKEEKLGLLMLFSAVEHPELMNNMLPHYQLQEDFEKEF